MALGYKSHVERDREQGLKQKVELQSFHIRCLDHHLRRRQRGMSLEIT